MELTYLSIRGIMLNGIVCHHDKPRKLVRSQTKRSSDQESSGTIHKTKYIRARLKSQ